MPYFSPFCLVPPLTFTRKNNWNFEASVRLKAEVALEKQSNEDLEFQNTNGKSGPNYFYCFLIYQEFKHTPSNCLMFPPHATSWRKRKARLTSALIVMAMSTNISLGRATRGTLVCDLPLCAICHHKLQCSSTSNKFTEQRKPKSTEVSILI